MTLKIYGTAASRAARPLWLVHEMGLAHEHIPLPFTGGACLLYTSDAADE